MISRGKVLYISTIEEGPYQGVRKKVSMQCKALENLGYEVLYINSGERSFIGQIEKLLPNSYGLNYRLIRKKILDLESNSLKYCYIRYSPASRGLIDIMRILKSTQKGIKIILEIPTYPYEDELKSIKAKPFKLKDRIFRMKMKQYVDLVITPSFIDEKEIFGIPAYEITNGIDIESVKTRNYICKEENRINLIGVALITSKQGYDRVIRGISKYNQTKMDNEPFVYFYIIGKGDAQMELEELCEELNVKDYVIFTGEKENEQLDYYYDTADIGVGTLGLYKTYELKKVNSLKTREYCAKGLPFIITDCDYMFAEGKFEFCYLVENKNESINIHSIIQFINEINEQYSADDISEKMNCFAKEKLSWSKILDSVIKNVDAGFERENN